jgi:hypothetical protein
MAIRDVHTAIGTLLDAITITSPVTSGIERVYKFTPPASQMLMDIPCVLLTYEQEPVLFKPGLMMKPYSIHIQVMVMEATMEADVGADMASEFLEKIILALSGDQTLGGTVSVIRAFRGGSPETVTVLEWGNKPFVGLDLYLDVTLTTATVHAP